MKFKYALLISLMIVITFSACSKKTHSSTAGKISDSVMAKKPVAKIRTPVPKVIIVNDSSASKTFDGRLYYDLGGKRYWRNNKDGKYYLYNKSMQNDEAFKGKKS